MKVNESKDMEDKNDGDNKVIDRDEKKIVRREIEMKGGSVLMEDKDEVKVK